MKALKQADLFLQTFFFICSVFSIIVSTEYLNPIFFISGLILTQLISIVVHTIAGHMKWKQSKWRKFHLYGMLAVVFLVVIASIQSSTARTGDKDDKYNMAGFGTFLIAAIPAILLFLNYIIITWKEWVVLKKGLD